MKMKPVPQNPMLLRSVISPATAMSKDLYRWRIGGGLHFMVRKDWFRETRMACHIISHNIVHISYDHKSIHILYYIYNYNIYSFIMWHLLQRLSVMTVAKSNLMYSHLGILHRLPGESQGLGVFVKDRGLKRLGSSGWWVRSGATRSLEDPTEQQSLSDTWGCNQLTMSKNVSLFCCTLHQSLSLFFATCGPGHLALRISKMLRRFRFALKECIFVPCKSVGKSNTSQDEHLFSGDPVRLVFISFLSRLETQV
jgi:hypothetical protein